MSGTLVVIDGADGSGKATQTKLLVERLSREGVPVATMDFPQYTSNIAGKLLRECLDGQRGDFMRVDPKVASMLYAVDRFESKSTIEGWLKEGKVVVLDRYVSANMMHQGAKLSGQEEVAEFLTWLDALEHGLFGLPRPALILYLDVPLEDRIQLLKQAVANREAHKGETVDVAEADLEHQRRATERAMEIVQQMNNWRHIVCTRDGQLREREDVHEEIYQIITSLR